MKKLLNILLVRRIETKNKWWDRLFNVFLGGTSILLLIFTLSLIVDSYNSSSVVYNPVAFSLESNYQQATGKEFPCNQSIDTSRSDTEPMKFTIECKGVEISPTDAQRYEELYDQANKKLRQDDGIDELSNKFIKICKDEVSSQTFPATYTGTLTPEYIAQIKCENLKEAADPSYNKLYDKYQNDLKSLTYIKATRNVHVGDITLSLLIPVLSVLAWVLFWSSIVYRSILYIVFGKKNK